MTNVAHIDNRAYEIDKDYNSILEFVKTKVGEKQIPTLCDDELLKPYGACRVCSVEIAQGSNSSLRTVASCHTPVTKDLRIFTNSKSLQKLRKNIVELVLTDHPLDCLVCEANNNCELQDVAASLGIRDVRYHKPKNHLDRKKDTSHSYMRMDLSKCINCSRCVRACDEIQGQFVLTMSGRGFDAFISKDNNVSFGDSSCVSCGACAQTCPTAAISDVFESKANLAAKKVRTVCSYCGVGCNLEVSVKGGDILSIQAPKDAETNNGHTCLKGRYAFKFYNHPERLTSPMIKKNDKFEKVSWEEAYGYIKDKINASVDKYGKDSVAGISSARCTNEENYLFQKMIRAAIGTNNVDCCARVCHSPTAYGMQQSFGTGAATNSIKDLNSTDLIMVIGANPTSAHPVTGAKIKQQAMKGKTLIVIDPVKTELAKVADYHIQLRPGTNVAVLNMMLFYIVESGLIAKDFINKYCEGYSEFEGKIKNIDLDYLEKISGVDRNYIKSVAVAYAKANNAMSFHGLGVTEHSQGSRTVMLIANLAMITGNIGRVGVGVNPLRGQNNVQGAADMGCQPHQGAGYLDMSDTNIQKYYSNKYKVISPVNPGLKIPEMFDAAINGDLKVLWAMGEDIAKTDPNINHVLKALNNLDLLVVQEIFMTDTAKVADVILPGASFLEKNGTFTNGERRVQRVNKVVEPITGSKTDADIICEMMKVLGYEQKPYSETEVLAEIADVVPFFNGITWDGLGTQGLQWPVAANGHDTKILHMKGFNRGKGKFHYFDFEETNEIIKYAKNYPYILTTVRLLEHYNAATMTKRTANINIISEDYLFINKEDAKSKGIDNNEKVLLFSGRGEGKLTAKISAKVKPGIVSTTFHSDDNLVNKITSSETDKHTLCPEYKVVAVNFKKAS